MVSALDLYVALCGGEWQWVEVGVKDGDHGRLGELLGMIGKGKGVGAGGR